MRVSVDALAGEAVASGPVGAPRAGFSLGVVDAFFVRAADEAVGDDHGLGGMLFEEGENLLANVRVVAHIGIFGEPTFEWVRLMTLIAHDADNDLRRESGGWPIESDSGGRITVKTLLGLPLQPRRRWLPVLLHGCSVWQCAQYRGAGI
jgi:hypothetical protein